MLKLALGILVVGLILFGAGIYYVSQDTSIMEEENKQYQGPVPEGYDEEHFRETGETKPLE